MTKEQIVRCTCERCGHQEEIAASFFSRYPPEWVKIEGKHICAKCSRDFKIAFNKFMAEGRK